MSRWISKPPIGSTINWSCPTAQGLVGCWLMNERGGKKVNDIAQNYMGVAQNIVWQNNAISFNGTTSLITCKALSVCLGNDASSPLSIVTGFVARSEGENEQGTIIRRGFSIGRWVLFFAVTQTNLIRFFKDGATDLSYTTAINLNQYYDFATTFNGTDIAGNVHMYSKGREVSYVAAVDGAGLAVLDSAKPVTIGAVEDGTNNWDGLISYLYLYSRVLSPSEITSLYEAPYQMIQEPTWRFYSIPAGAVGFAGRSVTLIDA